jgi:hypothetical protein
MVSVRVLERIEGISDHDPILLTTGTPKPSGNHRFKFELGWLECKDFQDMVKNVWDRPVLDVSPIQMWNNKLWALRTHFSGWARHVTGVLEKEKIGLFSIIDDLEDLAEVRPLSTQEIELKSQCNAAIASLLRRRSSSGTGALRASLFLKEIRILDSSIVSPMVDT